MALLPFLLLSIYVFAQFTKLKNQFLLHVGLNIVVDAAWGIQIFGAFKARRYFSLCNGNAKVPLAPHSHQH